MKIYFSPTSPFVRKCLIVAHELGLAGQIEKLPSAAHPVNHDQTVMSVNPLGQVPALVADDGLVLYDSRVICEYLNDRAQAAIIPAEPAAKWQALADQSLADGLLDAALLMRYEVAARPEALQWADWTQGQLTKVNNALRHFEERASSLASRIDIGTITLACALGYLDLRFEDLGWRQAHPGLAAWYLAFSQRPSMQATAL
jgi:glutathione S-transferase